MGTDVLLYNKSLVEASRYIDKKILELFAVKKPFILNLTKWQDDLCFDMGEGITLTMVLKEGRPDWKTNV